MDWFLVPFEKKTVNIEMSHKVEHQFLIRSVSIILIFGSFYIRFQQSSSYDAVSSGRFNMQLLQRTTTEYTDIFLLTYKL